MARTRSLLIKDLLVPQVATVKRETTLAQCAKYMREGHVGSLVVVDGADAAPRPIGIVTDRDIVVAAVAPGLDPEAITAGDVMAPSVAVVNDDDDAIDALARMREHGVRRLPVITRHGTLAGIIAMDDLIAVVADLLNGIVEATVAARAKEIQTRRA